MSAYAIDAAAAGVIRPPIAGAPTVATPATAAAGGAVDVAARVFAGIAVGVRLRYRPTGRQICPVVSVRRAV